MDTAALIISFLSFLISAVAIVVSKKTAHKQELRDMYFTRVRIWEYASDYLESVKGDHPTNEILLSHFGKKMNYSRRDVENENEDKYKEIEFHIKSLFGEEIIETYLRAKENAMEMRNIARDFSVLINMLQQGEPEKYLKLIEALMWLPWNDDFGIEDIDSTDFSDFCIFVDAEQQHTRQSKLDFIELWKEYSKIEEQYNKNKKIFIEQAKAKTKI